MKRNPLLSLVTFLLIGVSLFVGEIGHACGGPNEPECTAQDLANSPVVTQQIDENNNPVTHVNYSDGSQRVIRSDWSIVDVAGNSTPTSTLSTPASTSSSAGSKTDLKSDKFTFDPNSISPSSKKDWYRAGTGNIKTMTQTITNWLLVIVSTGTVLFIIVGGLFMATSAGDEDRSTKGKTIITYNIQALVIAMMSYGIIQLLIWILSPTG